MTESLKSLIFRAQANISGHSSGHVDELVGRELAGKYRVLELLGTGATASVYKAVDIILERPVAIKILHAEDEDVHRRFSQEVRIHSRLKHPNIVQALDCFDLDGESCFVMEYLPGVSLAELLDTKGGGLSAEDSAFIISRACAAIAYAHGAGIIHRDLKPANIVLLVRDEAVEVKVVDFGLAKAHELMQRITKTGVIVGSPYYMSPEQCMGEVLDNRSDIYSFGMIVYEIVTGQPPYKASTLNEIMQCHCNEAIRPVPLYSPELDLSEPIPLPVRLDKTIMAAMRADREKRYQSVDLFSKALETWYRLALAGAPDDKSIDAPSEGDTTNDADEGRLAEIWQLPALVSYDEEEGFKSFQLENIALHQTPTGQILNGRYRLDEILGQGGMSVVYRARNLESGEPVAAKTLKLSSLGVVDRFLREIRIHSDLNHPNIVKAVDHFMTESGQAFFFMELLDGITLQRFMNADSDQKISLEERCSILGQLLDALEYAHDMKVIHRDLKPDNIMLTRQAGAWRVKVLDFGLAKIQDDLQKLTSTGVLLGTPEYMSPEHCSGREPDGRSDLYSYAVVAYQLLSGALPYEAETDIGFVECHLDPDINPRPISALAPDLPNSRELDSILLRALESEPDKRQQSAAELKDALGLWWINCGRESASPFRKVRRRKRRAEEETKSLSRNTEELEASELNSLVDKFRTDQVESYIKSQRAPFPVHRLIAGLKVVVLLVGALAFAALCVISMEQFSKNNPASTKSPETEMKKKITVETKEPAVEESKEAAESSANIYGPKPTQKGKIIKIQSSGSVKELNTSTSPESP